MASAAILAGGRANRFGGRDKGQLVVGGRTILDRQLAELSQLTNDIIVVSGFSRTNRPPKGGHYEGIRLIRDRIADCGPLGGLDAALAAAQDDQVIVIAGDMPFITAPFLAHLAAEARDVDAVVPRTERGYHPLCAVYMRSCREAVARRLDRRELALTGLLNDLRVRIIEDVERFGPADRLLANVNTPAEFDTLEALLGHKL